MEKNFILMGDIIDSRKASQEELWTIFNKIIKDAKNEFSNKLASSLDIKIGDEFQVILKDMKTTLELLYYLDIYFKYENLECRFCIGYGEIVGNINKQTTNNMLGKTLTATYELLNEKKQKYSFFIENDLQKTKLLNTTGLMLENILSTLTNRQINFLFYKVIKNQTIKDLAKELNSTERNIYNYLERSKYNLIQEVFNQISATFDL